MAIEQSIEVITANSVYTVTILANGFRVVKTKELKYSPYVSLGEGYEVPDVWIDENGCLETEKIRTSHIQNLEEVKKWLGQCQASTKYIEDKYA